MVPMTAMTTARPKTRAASASGMLSSKPSSVALRAMTKALIVRYAGLIVYSSPTSTEMIRCWGTARTMVGGAIAESMTNAHEESRLNFPEAVSARTLSPSSYVMVHDGMVILLLLDMVAIA